MSRTLEAFITATADEVAAWSADERSEFAARIPSEAREYWELTEYAKMAALDAE